MVASFDWHSGQVLQPSHNTIRGNLEKDKTFRILKGLAVYDTVSLFFEFLNLDGQQLPNESRFVCLLF